MTDFIETIPIQIYDLISNIRWRYVVGGTFYSLGIQFENNQPWLSYLHSKCLEGRAGSKCAGNWQTTTYKSTPSLLYPPQFYIQLYRTNLPFWTYIQKTKVFSLLWMKNVNLNDKIYIFLTFDVNQLFSVDATKCRDSNFGFVLTIRIWKKTHS